MATESVANPAIRNTVIVPAAGLTAAGALQVSDSAPVNSIEQRLNQVGPAIDNFIGGLNFPGQRTLEKYGREQESRGLGAALTLATPFGFLAAPFIPNSGSKKQDPLSLRNKYGGSGDMDAGPGRVSFQSDRVAPAVLNGIPGIVDVNPQTGKMLPGTWRRGDMDAGPGKVSEMNDPSQADYVAPKVPPEERAYVEEVSRLAQQAQTDPYFQQMQQYEAARKQAVGSGNQAQMDAVRDLGLAINAAKFGTPEQRMQQTVGRFNPQMAGMPGYPATREAFEQQRPFIAPEEEARIGAMDMASQALQGAMQGQAGTQFPTQALGVMQRPAGVSPNTSVFAGPQAGQAGMSMSPTTDISALPEEAKAEFLKRLQSFRPM
jgi:hypothetical protein